MFNLLKGVDHRFLVLNIFFLMAIAIIPFPNAFIAEYLLEPEQQGVAVGVYGLAMLALAVMFNLVWWYASWRQRLIRSDCDYKVVRQVLKSYLMGPAIYLIGLVVSFFAPIVSLVIFVLVPVGYLFEGPLSKVDAGNMLSGD
jgi:uncharacterized membrane protein